VGESENINTVILGTGNILLGDEGIGVHIVKKLREEKLPPGVLAIDGSTAGFRLLGIFESYKNCKFIIIDALKISHSSRNSPDYNTGNIENKKNIPVKGGIYLIPLDELYDIIEPGNPARDFISFHQTELTDVLKLFSLIYNTKIKGFLIGINIFSNDEPDSTAVFSMELSEEIKKKIPEIIELAKKHI
jgi:Ni,Fe-hydrogenase maturation factor